MLLTLEIVSTSFYKFNITPFLLIYSFFKIILQASSSTTYVTIRAAYLSTSQLTITIYVILILYNGPAAYYNAQGKMLINNNLTYFITFLFIILKHLHFKLTSAFTYSSLFKNKGIKNSSLFICQLIFIIALFMLLPSYLLAVVFLRCL